MTDNEIKKALEEVKATLVSLEDNGRYYVSAYLSKESLEICMNALDLINRQQAEIAKLEEYIDRCKSGEEYWVKCLLERPNEAVKEFAERLHEYIDGVKERHEMPMLPFSEALVMGMEMKIDNLVKEMAGDTE